MFAGRVLCPLFCGPFLAPVTDEDVGRPVVGVRCVLALQDADLTRVEERALEERRDPARLLLSGRKRPIGVRESPESPSPRRGAARRRLGRDLLPEPLGAGFLGVSTQ